MYAFGVLSVHDSPTALAGNARSMQGVNPTYVGCNRDKQKNCGKIHSETTKTAGSNTSEPGARVSYNINTNAHPAPLTGEKSPHALGSVDMFCGIREGAVHRRVHIRCLRVAMRM